MDPFMFLLAGISIAVPLVARIVFHHRICGREWAAQTAVLLVVLVGGFALARAGQTLDVRIQNGELERKYSERVSCEHSYSCNCRTEGTGDSARRVCDTCYEHMFDYDWILDSTIGNIEVPRIDRQGTREPPRWTRAQIGDPVAKSEYWTNYVKGAPASVMRTDLDTDNKALVPPYPSAIHDLHYARRVLDLRAAPAQMEAWDQALAQALKTVGAKTRGNIVLILTDRPDRGFANLIERGWLRGKSNDTVVVLGVQDNKIAWSEAFGWAENPRLYVELRHSLEGLAAEPQTVIPAISQAVVNLFKPLPPDHFAHLGAEIRLPTWGYLGLGLLAILLSIGSTLYFHTHDPFQPRTSARSSRRLS